MPFVIDLTKEVDAPSEVVWDVARDVARYREWNPFCVDCRSTLRPGDPIEMKVKLIGRPQRQREWVREYTEGSGFAYGIKPAPAGALASRRSHEITALDGERSRYRSYFRLEGWLVPLVVTLLGGRLHAGFTGMTDALAARAEQLWTERKAQSL